MNIVFGGSFNPVTKAHKKIIETLIKDFNPENLIILPVGNSYGKTDLAPFNNRFEMLEIEFSKNNKVIISDIEKNKFLGTYNSLNILKETFDDIYFSMGSDNFLYLDKWIESEKLLSEFRFIIFNRSNVDLNYYINNKYKKYKNNFILIDFDEDISSSKFRENIYENKDLISEDIFNYIINNNLYKE